MTARRARRAKRQYGEGGISSYETAKGVRWRVSWHEPVDPDDPDAGLRRRSAGGFTDKKAAAVHLREQIRAAAEGKPTDVRNEVTLAQYGQEWLDSRRLAASTITIYRRMFRVHIEPALGRKRLSDIRAVHLAAFYRTLEQSGRRDHAAGQGLSPNTVLKIHVLLGAILDDAHQDHLIAVNPARLAKANPPTVAEVRSAKPEVHPWTPEQLGAFLTWCRAEEPTAPWSVLADTGMRRGEALGLRWGDVDIAGRRIAIRRAAVLVKEHGKGEWIVIKPPKSGRSRVIDIDEETLGVLKTRRDMLAAITPDLAAATAYVFPDDTGGVAHPERFSRRFIGAIARARKWLVCRDGRPNEPAPDLLPTIRLHDLRHTHATMLLTAGVHPKVVQERLGHQTIAITMDLYSHVQPTTQREAVTRFRSSIPTGLSDLTPPLHSRCRGARCVTAPPVDAPLGSPVRQ